MWELIFAGKHECNPKFQIRWLGYDLLKVRWVYKTKLGWPNGWWSIFGPPAVGHPCQLLVGWYVHPPFLSDRLVGILCELSIKYQPLYFIFSHASCKSLKTLKMLTVLIVAKLVVKESEFLSLEAASIRPCGCEFQRIVFSCSQTVAWCLHSMSACVARQTWQRSDSYLLCWWNLVTKLVCS